MRTAYDSGATQALAHFKLANARLIGTLGGLAAGYALSPSEEENGRAAILGGAGGYATGAAVSRGLDGVKALLKKADFGVGLNIPKTPFGINVGQKDERLEGMHRWVPRGYIERAHEGLDAGLDEQAILELEAQRGNAMHPMLGAGAGAAAAHFGLPGSSISTKLLGALVGAGAGSTFNNLTRPLREEDMAEALKGVQLERRNQSALTGQEPMTANESNPLLISHGGGGAG